MPDEHELPYFDPLYPEYTVVMRCYDTSDDYSDATCKASGCETIRDGIDSHGPYVLVGILPSKICDHVVPVPVFR
jgi:hypothetical protein